MEFEQNELIVTAGDLADAMYILLSGTVQPFDYLRLCAQNHPTMRLKIIGHVMIKTVGQSESCMVSTYITDYLQAHP